MFTTDSSPTPVSGATPRARRSTNAGPPLRSSVMSGAVDGCSVSVAVNPFPSGTAGGPGSTTARFAAAVSAWRARSYVVDPPAVFDTVTEQVVVAPAARSVAAHDVASVTTPWWMPNATGRRTSVELGPSATSSIDPKYCPAGSALPSMVIVSSSEPPVGTVKVAGVTSMAAPDGPATST